MKKNGLIPLVNAREVKARNRNVPHTDLGWEVNPDSFYCIVKKISQSFPGKDILITENGASYKDELIDGNIRDELRTNYFKDHLYALSRLKQEGVPVKGYFAWTLTDNFEWSEGYQAKFGIVHVDRKTLKRTVKDSGLWWQSFLK